MYKFKAVIDLVRPVDCLTHAILPLFALAIIFGELNMTLIYLFLFVTFAAFCGFALNNIADAELDKLDRKIRNPISQSKLNKYDAALISFLFLVLSIHFLFLLPKAHIILGVLALLIAFLHSFVLKSKPPFDLLFAAVPSIGFIMVYALFNPLDFKSLILSIIVFFSFAIGGLLQEIRDFDKDKKKLSNTVIKLGQEASIKLSISLFLVSIFLGLYLIYINLLPSMLIISIPLAYFLLTPLVKSLTNYKLRKELNSIYLKWGIIVYVVALLYNLFKSFIFTI